MVSANRGSLALHNHHGMIAHLEALIRTFEEFAAHFLGTSLSPKLRELLILQIAWRLDSELLWDAHMCLAVQYGITHLHIAALQQGQVDAYVFGPKESYVLRFASRDLGFTRLATEDLNDLRAHCSEREIIDVLAIDCLYRMIAILDVVLRSPTGPDLVP